MRILVVFMGVCLPFVAATAQTSLDEPTAPADSLSEAPQVSLTAADSARLERAQTQAKLSQEVSALSQSELGTGTFTWTHRAQLAIERAGQSQGQYFWANPKNETTPKLWSTQVSNENEVFYLDPVSGRAATLHLNRLSGSFIPARLAEQAGFTGNGSHFLPKKAGEWQAGDRSDTTQSWSLKNAEQTFHLVLSHEKDPARARAMVDWLKLQPMEGIALPSAAEKFPILELRIVDSAGKAVHHITCVEWIELEAPVEIDATALTISDPERDLKTIAREWAAKQAQEKESSKQN